MIVAMDGQLKEVDWTPPAAPSSRAIPTGEFLSLWTADEIAACQAVPDLNKAMLQAMLQPTINLDSTNLPPLLALAVSKGALTASRSVDILAGRQPPGA